MKSNKIKLTLDGGDEVEFEIDYIQSFKEAKALDGHKYILIEYDGDPEKKSNMYAVSDSLELVSTLINSYE